MSIETAREQVAVVKILRDREIEAMTNARWLLSKLKGHVEITDDLRAEIDQAEQGLWDVLFPGTVKSTEVGRSISPQVCPECATSPCIGHPAPPQSPTPNKTGRSPDGSFNPNTQCRKIPPCHSPEECVKAGRCLHVA